MTSLLDFPSPPASAYGAKPLSPEEIDAHPDRDRLWATIMVLRDDADNVFTQGYEAGIDDAITD